ncbi:heptosyltransferase III [uncultured bacterium]|nr:heptosyltransferase III [uncultured bacterium]
MKKTCSALKGFVLSPSFARFIGEPFFFLMGMRTGAKTEMGRHRRILVVKLDEIGDAVMLTPFVRELRAGLPQAWITLVVKPQLKELWDICPYVDEVVAFDRQAGPSSLRGHLRALLFAAKKLWKKRFDLAIVPRWDSDIYNASFLAYFSGARERLGYSESVIAGKRQLNKGYDRLYTKVSFDAGLKHDSLRNLDLLRGMGLRAGEMKTELWVNQDDLKAADELLASKGVLRDDLLACIYPSGGSSVLKQWPVENFIELGRWIQKTCGAKVIVAGGPGDEKVCREVTEGVGGGAVNLCGGLGLRRAAAVFKRCGVFIGNDTGPTHMAAAMGAPVIAIFGSSCPHRFAPVGDKCVVLWKAFECSPCFLHDHADRCAECIHEKTACLEALTLSDLKKAVTDILGKAS